MLKSNQLARSILYSRLYFSFSGLVLSPILLFSFHHTLSARSANVVGSLAKAVVSLLETSIRWDSEPSTPIATPAIFNALLLFQSFHSHLRSHSLSFPLSFPPFFPPLPLSLTLPLQFPLPPASLPLRPLPHSSSYTLTNPHHQDPPLNRAHLQSPQKRNLTDVTIPML